MMIFGFLLFRSWRNAKKKRRDLFYTATNQILHPGSPKGTFRREEVMVTATTTQSGMVGPSALQSAVRGWSGPLIKSHRKRRKKGGKLGKEKGGGG